MNRTSVAWLAVGAMGLGLIAWSLTKLLAKKPIVDDVVVVDAHSVAPKSITHDTARDGSDEYPNEDAPDGSVMSPACWSRTTANQTLFENLSRDACSTIYEIRCLPVSDATWATRVLDASVATDVDEGCGLSARIRVERETDAGTAFGEAFETREVFGEKHGVRLRELSDYDHDGAVEVLMTYSSAVGERTRSTVSTILTLRDGKLVAYPPPAAFLMRDALDVDGDGVIDLVGVPAAFGNDPAPAIFAAHALADGTFSTTDDAARAFAKKKCASAAKKIVGTYDAIDDDTLAIVCARLRGEPADEVTRSIEKVCPADAAHSECREWDRLAAATPPFTF